MRVRLDTPTGYAYVDLNADGRWIRLRRPTAREWAEWSDALGRIPMFGDLPVTEVESYETSIFASGIVELGWEILTTLTRSPVVRTDDEIGQLRVSLADRVVVTRLLSFWWHHPIAPWGGDRPPPPRKKKRGESDDPPRKLGTQLLGGLGVLSIFYQALATIGMGAGFTPSMIDEMELWQIATLLGMDWGDDMDEDGVGRRADGLVDYMSWQRRPDQPYLFENWVHPNWDRGAAPVVPPVVAV